MDSIERPDTTTGKPPEQTPILASAAEPTADASTPAPASIESASIKTKLILALWQTDCSDLQLLGLKVAILARDGKVYASLEYPGHVLTFSDGNLILDGEKVSA